MDIQEWAFNNEQLVLEKAGLNGELISLKEYNDKYTVVAIDDGMTIMSHVSKEWIKKEASK